MTYLPYQSLPLHVLCSKKRSLKSSSPRVGRWTLVVALVTQGSQRRMTNGTSCPMIPSQTMKRRTMKRGKLLRNLRNRPVVLRETDWRCWLYPPVNRCRQWKILSSMGKIMENIDTATSCWRVGGFPSPRQKRISSNFESFCGITCPKCTDMLRYVVHPSNFGPCEA